jgi:hypothetical protein
MEHNQTELGTVTVLLERLAKERLPEAMAIKARIDQGECLTEFDIEFLERIFHDAEQNKGIISKFPEYKDVIGKAVSLYHDIMARALENEQQGKQG